MTDLHRLTATEASKLIAKREISSEDLVKACLDRIHARESTVQAWAHLDEKLALQAAHAADAHASRSPLHGIPFGAKDVIDSADLPTEYGSEIFKGHRPAHDAACIQRMKAAGAVLMGKRSRPNSPPFGPARRAIRKRTHDILYTCFSFCSASRALLLFFSAHVLLLRK